MRDKKDYNKLTRQTLDFVNLNRMRRKLPKLKSLRKGDSEACNTCPIANSLSEGEDSYVVFGSTYCKDNGDLITCAKSLLPSYVKEWIVAFDGKFACEDVEDVYGEFREELVR